MISTIARGVFGVYFTYAEVDMMWRRWLTGDASAASDALDDDDDAPGNWFIGQAPEWGLEGGFGSWTSLQNDSEDLYFVHLPNAPVLEGTISDIAGGLAALVDLDVSNLEQFCSEFLLLTSLPTPEYRTMKVLE